jgi:hypothetical protein
MLFKGEPPGWILYKVFVNFGNYFFPILIASAVNYLITKRRMQSDLKPWSSFFQIPTLFIIILIGLAGCVTFDAIIFRGISKLDPDTMFSDYKKEILSAAPISLLIAFAFPLLDKITLERVEELES